MRHILAVLACLVPVAAFAGGATQPPGLTPGKNLSDLPSAATARTNLGLGTLATQNAASAAITGGTISGADVSGANATATGGTAARTQAAIAADEVNVKFFGAKGDTLSFADGTIAAGSSALSSTSATFTANDIGKAIILHGTGTSGAAQQGTITGYTDAHHVTLSLTAVSAMTGAGQFTYGTDDTAAITAAVSAASGKTLFLPAGGYWLASQSAAIALNNVNVVGAGMSGVGWPFAGAPQGSFLLISNATTSAFSGMSGVHWRSVGIYYPAQDGAQTSPLTYPATFESTQFVDDSFENLRVLNSYDLFKTDNSAATSSWGRVTFHNVRAYCVDKCFWFLNGAADTIQIDATNYFGPGAADGIATGGAANLATYTAANGEFLRVDVGTATYQSIDGMMFTGFIVQGTRYLVRILSGTVDVSNWANLNLDGIGSVLSVEGTSTIISTSISGGEIYSSNSHDATQAANVFDISSTADSVELNITGISVSFAQGSIVFDHSIGIKNLNIAGNKFSNWGRSTTVGSYYGIAFAGNTTENLNATGNMFYCNKPNNPTTNSVNGIFVSGGLATNIGSNNFITCTIPVSIAGDRGTTIIGGNNSIGTLATMALNDTSSGTAIVFEGRNAWDKAPNKFHVGALTSTADGIVAAAGGGQANATLLTAHMNRVPTVATAADSVKLPLSVAGMCMGAVNASTNPMQLFGTGSDTVNDVASATGVSVAAGKTGYWCALTAGKWYGGTLN